MSANTSIDCRAEAASAEVEVIVVSRPVSWPPHRSSWKVSGVLIHERGHFPRMHPRWPRRWCTDEATWLTDEWNYLAERVNEGRGGNGYTFELVAFIVDDDADIDALVEEYDDRLDLNLFGPYGDGAAIFNPFASA